MTLQDANLVFFLLHLLALLPCKPCGSSPRCAQPYLQGVITIHKDGGCAQHHSAALDPVFAACMTVQCCSDARVTHQVYGIAHVSTSGSRHIVAAIQDPCQSQGRRCHTPGKCVPDHCVCRTQWLCRTSSSVKCNRRLVEHDCLGSTEALLDHRIEAKVPTIRYMRRC